MPEEQTHVTLAISLIQLERQTDSTEQRMPGVVELNASCLVLTVAALAAPVEAVQECRGHLGWLGRGYGSEGTDETALGSDGRGSHLARSDR